VKIAFCPEASRPRPPDMPLRAVPIRQPLHEACMAGRAQAGGNTVAHRLGWHRTSGTGVLSRTLPSESIQQGINFD